MDKKWAITGIIVVILAIILGAFGAHGLKNLTQDEHILAGFDTATKYQFFGGLSLLIIPFWVTEYQLKANVVFSLLLTGIVLFSGSIYTLTAAKVHGIPSLLPIAGPLTPIGGTLMIVAWFILLVKIFRK